LIFSVLVLTSQQYGVVNHAKYGKIYAYEVDGLGKHLLMDDANVPSLLSIPYLGWDYDPEIYQNTRRFILSPDNEFYKESADGKLRGIGSPHGGNYFANRHKVRSEEQLANNIWPMSQVMQGTISFLHYASINSFFFFFLSFFFLSLFSFLSLLSLLSFLSFLSFSLVYFDLFLVADL
jgi:hypothetical protein